MKKLALFISFFLTLAISANAQVASSAKEQAKKRQPPKNEQRQIDDQMASQCFMDQEYDKAKEIYAKLYKDYQQLNYFNQYIECLIRLSEFDEAEKRLRSFTKDNPNQVKSKVDLIYVYHLDNEKDKAEKLFNEILKTLPENASVIQSYVNVLRARGLNEQALAILEKGAKINSEGRTFNLDRAYIYQTMANYQEAFRYYFMELEDNPNQYKSIKMRLQSMLFYDVNKSITDELRIALLKKTQEKPDNQQFAELLVWLALQEEDYDIALEQSKSIDRRGNDQEGQIISLSNICLDNRQYDVAHDGFDYIRKKGRSHPFYADALIGLINTDYQKFKAENVSDKKSYETLADRISEAYEEVGLNEYANLVAIQSDIMAYQLGKQDEAISLIESTLEQTPGKIEQARLKLKLADIYLHEDEVWEATLLYSQVDKSMKEEPLGHEARFKNAQLRYFIGEFAWAQVQLKVLKAATSKLIANDAMTLTLIIKDNLETDTTGLELCRLARADYRIFQQKDDEALSLLDSIISNGNETSIPHALFRKAQIIEKNKDFESAKSIYLKIVEQFAYSYMADAALMQAALIEQNRLYDKTSAAQHYEKLIDEYPTSIYTAQAKKNYRKLEAKN